MPYSNLIACKIKKMDASFQIRFTKFGLPIGRHNKFSTIWPSYSCAKVPLKLQSLCFQIDSFSRTWTKQAEAAMVVEVRGGNTIQYKNLVVMEKSYSLFKGLSGLVSMD